MKKFKPHKVEKGWGYELHIHNANGYCSKILHIDEGKKFSMHFHIEKHETWYVASGELGLQYIDTKTADIGYMVLRAGDAIVVERGQPHQLLALKNTDIFEASTPDSPEDSYRVGKGDSQN